MSSGASSRPPSTSTSSNYRPYLPPHASPRDIALATIQDLPDSVSFEQLLAELQKEHCIARGLDDFKAGHTLSVQDLRRQLAG